MKPPNKINSYLVNLPFKKLGLYFYNNLTGTVLETGILWVLSNQVFKTYVGKYIIATIIAFEITMLKNYVFSYFKIWHDTVQNNLRDFLKKLLYYNTNMAAGLGIKLLMIIAIERVFHLHVVYCNLIAMLFTGIINYFIQDKLIFRKAKAKVN